MNRRKFIKNTSAGIAALSIAPKFLNAVPQKKIIRNEELLDNANDRIMIIVELFGGNDGLNTILPYEQEDEYRRLRQNLFIPKEFALRFGTSDLYFNAALAENIHNDGFLRMFDEGRLAIVQGIGYDSPTQSHFRSRDIWHSGINSTDPDENLLEGWVGRFIASKLSNYPDNIPEQPIAISIGSSVPLIFKSNIGDMGISLYSPESFAETGMGLKPQFNRFPAPESSYYQKEFNFIHVIAEQSELYSKAVYEAYNLGKAKITVDYSSGLSQGFRIISSLIAGGLKTQIYYLNLSGFDSHAQQMQADYRGAHAALLSSLATAVSEFTDDAVRQGFHHRVAGMTISEFGRRAYDNGSRGTDHGAASMQFVFGGSDAVLEGGYYRVEGKPNLFDLDQYGNLRHDYDFRRIYTDFLETWLGGSKDDTKNVLGEQFISLGILKSGGSSVNNSFNNDTALKVYPNPVLNKSKIYVEIKRFMYVEISIFNLKGFKVSDVYKGFSEAGIYEFDLNINHTGTYIAAIFAGKKKSIFQFNVIK